MDGEVLKLRTHSNGCSASCREIQVDPHFLLYLFREQHHVHVTHTDPNTVKLVATQPTTLIVRRQVIEKLGARRASGKWQNQLGIHAAGKDTRRESGIVQRGLHSVPWAVSTVSQRAKATGLGVLRA